MILFLSLLKNLGEMFPLFLTHFSDLWHKDTLNPLAHAVEIKEQLKSSQLPVGM